MTQWDEVKHMVMCNQCGAQWVRGQLPGGRRPQRRRYNGLDAKAKIERDFCCVACMKAFEAAHPLAREG